MTDTAAKSQVHMTYRSEHPYVDAPQSPWTRYAFCCPHLLSSKLLPRLFTSVTGSTIHLMDQNRNQKVSLNSCLFLNPYLLSIKVHLGMGGGGENTDENHIFQPPLQLGVTIQLFRPKRWKQKCMELPDSCLERLTQPLPSPPSCLPHFLTKKKKRWLELHVPLDQAVTWGQKPQLKVKETEGAWYSENFIKNHTKHGLPNSKFISCKKINPF